MNRFRNVKTWLWALAACLAVALAIWKGPKRHFPYTGTWISHNSRGRRIVLTIDKDEKWSVNVIGRLSFDHMEGNSAITKFVSPLPNYTQRITSRFTPLDNGQTLREEALKNTRVDSKTGNVEVWPATGVVDWHKVKDWTKQN